jgi:hypothetical protein
MTQKEMSPAEGLEKIQQLLSLAGIDQEKYEVSVKRTRDKEPLPPTVMLFQTFSDLASSQLSPAACKVLFFFFAQTQYQNVVSIDQFTIASHVKLTERTVRSAIKELTDHNILTSVPLISDRRRNEYILNPYSSWKGSSSQRNYTIQNLDPDQLSMFGIESKQLKENERQRKLESFG